MTYEIEMYDNGMCDVTEDGRAVAYDRDDLDEALQVIRDEAGSGVTVVIVEPDGWRREEQT